MGISSYGRDQLLDAVVNADTTGLPGADLYLQLHNGDPGINGTSNVVSIGRQQVAFGASASGLASNSGTVDFTSMPTVSAPGVVAWSLHDTAGSGSPPTGGNCWWYGWLEAANGLMVVEAADLTGNDITAPSHGMVNDDRVVFETIEGLTLPTGVTAGTLYWVLATTTDTFTISTTQDGSAVDITAVGRGVYRKISGRTATSGDTFRVQAGDLDLYLAA